MLDCFLFIYRSGNGSKWSPSDSASSLKSDLHLDDEKETETYCCQEHFALSMAPTYSNKPDWVHVLPIPDLKRYVIFFDKVRKRVHFTNFMKKISNHMNNSKHLAEAIIAMRNHQLQSKIISMTQKS